MHVTNCHFYSVLNLYFQNIKSIVVSSVQYLKQLRVTLGMLTTDSSDLSNDNLLALWPSYKSHHLCWIQVNEFDCRCSLDKVSQINRVEQGVKSCSVQIDIATHARRARECVCVEYIHTYLIRINYKQLRCQPHGYGDDTRRILEAGRSLTSSLHISPAGFC